MWLKFKLFVAVVVLALSALAFQRPVSPENGISIGRTKVFDNRALVLMLESLGETLKGLQVIEADPLKKALTNFQGSSVRDSASSFSISAGGTPKLVSTNDSQNQTDDLAHLTQLDGKKGDVLYDKYIEDLVEKKIMQKSSQNVVTTQDARTPSAPNLPDILAAPGGLPSYGQNSLDLLSDQVNLTYQIFNLRMVLERSLSDRLHYPAEGNATARLQAVLGFNVSLDPPRDAAGAAAVVEITVENYQGRPVSLVALMPQERTYNAMALNSKSNAFGGSAVFKLVTVGYSQRRRGQNFYLYRDNDTISFERMNADNNELTFGWQFRPVLGRRSVAPGMRQMFAVVSIPAPDALTGARLRVRSRTYWRKFYPDTLTTANRSAIGPWPYIQRAASLSLARSVPNGTTAFRQEIARCDDVHVPSTNSYQAGLRPEVTGVKWSIVDSKNAFVSLTGHNFFTGTNVLLGSPSAASAVIKSDETIDIVTPTENLAVGQSVVVGRYGPARPIEMKLHCAPPQFVPEGSKLSGAFGGQREFTAVFRHGCAPAQVNQPFVVLVANKAIPTPVASSHRLVAAATNADCQIKDCAHTLTTIRASIPASMFSKTDSQLSVVYPFHGPDWRMDVVIPEPSSVYEITRLKASTGAQLLIRRNDVAFDNKFLFGATAASRWPVTYNGVVLPHTISGNNLSVFLPDNPDEGQILLMEPIPNSTSERPVVLDLPALKPKAPVAIQAAAGVSLILKQNDAPKLDFTGDKVSDVARVYIEGKSDLVKYYDDTKKTLTIFFTQDLTTKPADNLALQFRDASGKLLASLKLEIKPQAKQKASKADAAIQ